MIAFTMGLSIFWRLILGYLIIFILVMMVGVFAFLQVRQFHTVTQYVINVDNRILEYEKKLEESLLSQHRFLKKSIISKDLGLYAQFISSKEVFLRDLGFILNVADTPSHVDLLKKIREAHGRYLILAEEESGYILSRKKYPKKHYEEEKERLIDEILNDFEQLDIRVRQDAQLRMQELGEKGDAARDIALILASVALGTVIVISFLITRGITKPLNLLRIKTREISEGIFKSDLNISSSPEISDLAQAFNLMTHSLSTLDRMKSDFFSTMSHELRTPLTSIKEGIALLQEETAGPVTEKQKKLLSIVSQESRRLIDLVNSSLDLSKMESGMMTYHFETADLAVLINQVLLEMIPLLETKKILLENALASGLPKIRVDRERMLQVLRNLLSNAVKFTPEGGRIIVSAEGVGKEIRVAVKDSGPGIPAEQQTTVFFKFHQGDTGKSYPSKGSGLGLAIVKHIITSHGGRVWVESQEGRGSSFFFILPV
ncbi:MAG: HAMP domain-containing sensor histidine kinase [Thermodesulfobacteriota bacterium]